MLPRYYKEDNITLLKLDQLTTLLFDYPSGYLSIILLYLLTELREYYCLPLLILRLLLKLRVI
jgi:hypothetical protein